MKRIAVLLVIALLCSACATKQAAAPTLAPTPTLEQLLNDALRLINEGRYEEAILAYEGAIAIEPKRAASYLQLADAYQKQNKPTQALAVLEQGLNAVHANNALLFHYYQLKSAGRVTTDWRQIYMDFLENSLLSFFAGCETVSLTLLDLDFDGVPELFIQPDTGGSGGRYYPKLYTIGTDGSVKGIEIGPVIFGTEDAVRFRLYQNRVTKELCYMSQTAYGDYCDYSGLFPDRLKSNDLWWRVESTMMYTEGDGGIEARFAAYRETIDYEDGLGTEEFAFVDGREVAAADYQARRAQFFSVYVEDDNLNKHVSINTQVLSEEDTLYERLQAAKLYMNFYTEPDYDAIFAEPAPELPLAVADPAVKEAYRIYIQDTLIPRYGLADPKYLQDDSWWGLEDEHEVFHQNATGLFSARIEDMDGDGTAELLVLLSENGSDIYLHAYTLTAGKVHEFETDIREPVGIFVEVGVSDTDIRIVEYEGRKYIVCAWYFYDATGSDTYLVYSVEQGKLYCDLCLTLIDWRGNAFNAYLVCKKAPVAFTSRAGTVRESKEPASYLKPVQDWLLLYHEELNEGGEIIRKHDPLEKNDVQLIEEMLGTFGVRLLENSSQWDLVPSWEALMKGIRISKLMEGWQDYTDLHDWITAP